MPTWKEVETQLTAIEMTLANDPPDLAKAKMLANRLKILVANRPTPQVRTFSKPELLKAIPHLAFEMLHFRSFSKLYDNMDLARISGAASQAVRYCFLLHMRLLIDFFFKEKPIEDDCLVNHFNILDGFEAAFPASLHVPTDETREMSTHLNKLLAHLTATRWEEDRPWMDKYDKYGATIDELISNFQDALPEDVQKLFLNAYCHWERAHPPNVVLPEPIPSNRGAGSGIVGFCVGIGCAGLVWKLKQGL
jgi:hypothetical protein